MVMVMQLCSKRVGAFKKPKAADIHAYLEVCLSIPVKNRIKISLDCPFKVG